VIIAIGVFCLSRMTILTCPIPGCGFATQDVDVIGAAAILNVHANLHVATNTPAPVP